MLRVPSSKDEVTNVNVGVKRVLSSNGAFEQIIVNHHDELNGFTRCPEDVAVLTFVEVVRRGAAVTCGRGDQAEGLARDAMAATK